MVRVNVPYFRYFGLFLGLITTLSYPCEQKPTKAEAIQPSSTLSVELLLSKDIYITKQIITEINAVPAQGYVGIDNPYLTNPQIIRALVAASKRNVTVNASVGRGTKASTIKQLTDAKVKVNIKPDLHAKRCLISHQDPKDIQKNKGATTVCSFAGSYNFSNISWGHHEAMVKSNDIEDFVAHYNDQQDLFNNTVVDKENASPVKQTPKKKTVYNSFTKNLNESKSCRIKKMLEELQPEDRLDITSMTYDTQDITAALEAVANNAYQKKFDGVIRLFLDSSAVKHTDLLDRLHAAGIKIFIYNHDHSAKIFNKFPKLQHTKLLARYRAAASVKHLVVVSTGNLAQQSNREYNVDSYYPGDEQLYKRVVEFCNELEKNCTPYGTTTKKASGSLKEEKELMVASGSKEFAIYC